MRKITIFNYIAGVMLLLCLGFGAFAQEIKPHARITQGGFHPLTCPQGFIQNRDLWQDTISNETWIATSNTKWRLSPTQLGKGIKGDKGDTGANGLNGTNGVDGKDGKDGIDGVCPSCPPSSGGGDGKARTWAELIAQLNNDNIRAVTLGADIVVQGKWRVSQTYNRFKILHGDGYKLTIPSNIDTFIVRTYTSLSEANKGIDTRLIIENVDFYGSNNIAIYMEANYGSEISSCNFRNFKYAMDLRWCMGTNIVHNYFWENYVSINLDYARFTGGSNSASQSNHPYIAHNKYRSSDGQLANIRIIACSGVEIYHEIWEGVLNGADYHLLWDDQNSNVVHGLNGASIHAENKAKIASIYIKQKQGVSTISDYFGQYDNTIVKFESSAYAKLLLKRFPYLTSGSKFQSVSGGRIQFEDFPAEFTITDATKWIGSIPYGISIKGWQTNGQTPYQQGITVR